MRSRVCARARVCVCEWVERWLQEANDPDDDVLTRDAVALQSVMKTAIRQVKNEAARTAKANKVRLQAAVRAAGVYAAREVRRWETRPGTALAKRKRARSSGSKVAEDEDEDGSTYRDDWEVVAGRSGANTIVLRKMRKQQIGMQRRQEQQQQQQQQQQPPQ